MTMWIVVADATRCKIYEQEQHNGKLIEKDDLIHPASRMKDEKLVSDRPGGDHGSVGQGRHPMPSRTEAKDHEAEVFARDIAQNLEAGRTQGAFDRLVLMAPPAFLGALRNSLGDALSKMVAGDVDKDLVRNSADEISTYLKQVS